MGPVSWKAGDQPYPGSSSQHVTKFSWADSRQDVHGPLGDILLEVQPLPPLGHFSQSQEFQCHLDLNPSPLGLFSLLGNLGTSVHLSEPCFFICKMGLTVSTLPQLSREFDQTL